MNMLDTMKEQLERMQRFAPTVLASPDAASRLQEVVLPFGVKIEVSEYLPKGTMYIVYHHDIDRTIDIDRILYIDDK